MNVGRWRNPRERSSGLSLDLGWFEPLELRHFLLKAIPRLHWLMPSCPAFQRTLVIVGQHQMYLANSVGVGLG